MSSPETTCPGCQGRRRTGQLLCRSCWTRLPRHHRGDLFRTWTMHKHHLSSDAYHRDYLGSRRVAVHWLRSRTAS